MMMYEIEILFPKQSSYRQVERKGRRQFGLMLQRAQLNGTYFPNVT
jgi:hypothetical protein